MTRKIIPPVCFLNRRGILMPVPTHSKESGLEEPDFGLPPEGTSRPPDLASLIVLNIQSSAITSSRI